MLVSTSAAGGFVGTLFTLYVLGVLAAFGIGVMTHGVRKRSRRNAARAALAWPATLIRTFRGSNEGRTVGSTHTQSMDHEAGPVPGTGTSPEVPGSNGGGLTIKQYGLIEEPDE